MVEDTVFQRIRSGAQLVGAILTGLMGAAFGFAILAFGLYLPIVQWDQARRLEAIIGLVVFTLPLAVFGAAFGIAAIKRPIALWRDRRTPLPAIDGTPIVIARKRPRRLWPTLALSYGFTMTLLLASTKSPEMTAVQYVFVALVILSFLISLQRVWFPARLRWEPVVLDADGIEDRSLGMVKLPWSDVAKISTGLQTAPNGILLKLVKPVRRLPGQGFFATGILPIIDRLLQGRRHLVIRGHGLALHSERTFRLVQAYCRYSEGRAGNGAAASDAVGNNARANPHMTADVRPILSRNSEGR